MNDETLTTAERELIEKVDADLQAQAKKESKPTNTWCVYDTSTGELITEHPTRDLARENLARWRKERIAIGLDPKTLRVERNTHTRPRAQNITKPVRLGKSMSEKVKTAKRAVAKGRKSLTKTAKVKQAVVPTNTKASKKDRALNIYRTAEKAGNATRKVVLPILMKDLELSKPGASTYFQNMKSGKWS